MTDIDKKIRLLDKKIDKLRQKIKREDDFKTIEAVFDTATLLALYKLFSDGTLDILNGVISTGKEANVYWGIDSSGNDVAVKIYRTSTLDFKRLTKYIEGDPRFIRTKKKTHSRVYQWAQKEFKNLSLAKKVGVSVPTPIAIYKNILIMEFIGESGLPAPLLKDYIPDDVESIFEQIISDLELLFKKAKLVHADLSEYNILVFKNKSYLIDMGQAVKLEHPNSMAFLVRDIRNILNFFKNEVRMETPSFSELFEKITGMDINEYPHILEDTEI